MKTNKHRINHNIRSPQVRIITETENKVMSLRDGLKLADLHGVDLIEISPDADPPVCKLENYGKFLYKMEKSKPKVKSPKEKEIGLHANVGENDFQIKLRQAQQFLQGRCRVLFRLKFRGRENTHKDLGENLFRRLTESLTEHGNPEPHRVNGSSMMMLVTPKS